MKRISDEGLNVIDWIKEAKREAATEIFEEIEKVADKPSWRADGNPWSLILFWHNWQALKEKYVRNTL